MKRIFACILTVVMLLTLTACGGANLTTFEMTCEPDGAEGPAKVTIGYPDGFTMEETDWCVILTDEKKDVEIEAYFLNDYNCYNENQEYAKTEYFYYEEFKFGKYNGYACLTDEASTVMDVYVYLECVGEIDDVYVSFSITSASRSLEKDPKDLFKLAEVRQVLDSVVYTAPAA